ncbi:hypothetical protein HAX54_039028, partial [Datura stramonium]|nr:hypothetical protein [Datura stramonium]
REGRIEIHQIEAVRVVISSIILRLQGPLRVTVYIKSLVVRILFVLAEAYGDP